MNTSKDEMQIQIQIAVAKQLFIDAAMDDDIDVVEYIAKRFYDMAKQGAQLHLDKVKAEI